MDWSSGKNTNAYFAVIIKLNMEKTRIKSSVLQWDHVWTKGHLLSDCWNGFVHAWIMILQLYSSLLTFPWKVFKQTDQALLCILSGYSFSWPPWYVIWRPEPGVRFCIKFWWTNSSLKIWKFAACPTLVLRFWIANNELKSDSTCRNLIV